MDRLLPFKFKHASRERHVDEDSLSGYSLLLKEEINTSTSRQRFWLPILAHILLIGIYTTIFVIERQECNLQKIHGVGIIDTPARSAVIYRSQIFDVPLEVTSPYVGKPRPELDHAWHELLQYTNIRISEDEMRKTGHLSEGIKFPDGGYFGSLMVYHQLHCIKRLHHYMFAEHYFPNATDIEKRHDILHNKHCLDILRQSIQCQGDSSIITMRWGKHQAIPFGNFTNPHECVNWDSLDNWAKERSVNVFAPGVLVHPTLGPSFPDGKGSLIGVAEDG